MNSKLQILFPILLAGALALGLFVGMGLGDSSPGNPIVFRGSQADKFAKVVRYVENEYVDSINTSVYVDKAIQGFLQDLDPHSYFISAEERAGYSEPLEGNFDGVGIEFRIVKDTVVVIDPITGGPSESVGIMAGDRIISVEDSTIAGVGVINRTVMNLLRGERGTVVNVKVKRHSVKGLISFKITRGEIPIVSVPVHLKIDDRTGYINISRFARTTYNEFKDAMNELGPEVDRLVIDLRGNGGGFLQTAISLVDEFLGEGELIVYTEGEHQDKKTFEATSSGRLENKNVVILINEGSASASEILAGAIQDNDRGTIIGRRSFGKGLVQNEIEFDDNSALRLTIARYYTPSGRSIQRPYGKNIDYENDYMDRIERGELVSADNISFPDSMKYKTKNGRTVYGGGGIMPDIFIPIDTTENSAFLNELLYNGIINQFAFQYADSRRDVLESMGSADSFDKTFQVNESMFNKLIDFAEASYISPSIGDLGKSKEQIKRRLKANVARIIWGQQGYFTVYLKDDNEFKAAIDFLNSKISIDSKASVD